MDQLAGEVAGLGEEEEANLRHMRAGGDVNQVLLLLRIEGIRPGKIVERAIHRFEVPRLVEFHPAEDDLGFGRHTADVVLNRVGQRLKFPRIQEIEPGDKQVLMLAETDRGTPQIPALRLLAAVQRGP